MGKVTLGTNKYKWIHCEAVWPVTLSGNWRHISPFLSGGHGKQITVTETKRQRHNNKHEIHA